MPTVPVAVTVPDTPMKSGNRSRRVYEKKWEQALLSIKERASFIAVYGRVKKEGRDGWG